MPAVTITPQGQVIRIVHVNRAAGEAHIHCRQTLADAKAIVPHLVTYDDDPAGDRRQLESLATWADCLSPIVHLDGADALLLDVTGCERLFGGEAVLLERAVGGVQAQGFTVRAAIADTPGAAWALAHAHGEPTIVADPGQTAASLAPLPVWSLRIDETTTAALASVGVETIGTLLYLPRSSLHSRFGRGILERIDQALGDLPEVLVAYRPEPVLVSRFSLGAAVSQLELLEEAVRRAMGPFCEALARKVAGVRRMFVTFCCPDVMTAEGPQNRTVTLPIELSRCTHSAEHLLRLIRVRLERLHLPGPAEALTLWTREIEPLDGWQDELFATDEADAAELANLLDRLVVRLGVDAVLRPQLLSEHQPERAFRYVSVVEPPVKASSNSTAVAACRPLRLVSPPVEIAATSIVPAGAPIAFRLRGAAYTIAESAGPERIETGWWRGPHIQRDYYRVITGDGRRCWLFRNRPTGQWFLQGWFD